MDSSQVSRMMQLYVYQNMFSSMGSSNTSGSSSGSYSSLFQMLMTQALTEYMEKEGLKTNVTAAASASINANTSESGTSSQGEKVASDSNQTVNNTKKVQSTSQSNIDKAIESASKKFGIDEDLIRAVIKQESGFNQYALSSAGAQGLMQLMPATADSLGVENPFNALDNISGGTRYLRSLMEAFDGNTQLALAAYNGGIGRMNKLGVDTTEEIAKMPSETRQYVAKVISNYNKYKNI